MCDDVLCRLLGQMTYCLQSTPVPSIPGLVRDAVVVLNPYDRTQFKPLGGQQFQGLAQWHASLDVTTVQIQWRIESVV